jgi:hypothetical protein
MGKCQADADMDILATGLLRDVASTGANVSQFTNAVTVCCKVFPQIAPDFSFKLGQQSRPIRLRLLSCLLDIVVKIPPASAFPDMGEDFLGIQNSTAEIVVPAVSYGVAFVIGQTV